MPAGHQSLLDRIKVLETENSNLTKVLAQCNQPTVEFEALRDQYDKLSKAHEELQDVNAKYRSYVDRATEKYRAAKETVKQWQQFYDHQQRKADRLCERLSRVNRASRPLLEAEDFERTPRATNSRGDIAHGGILDERRQGSGEIPEACRDTNDDEGLDLPRPSDGDLEKTHAVRSSQSPKHRARHVTSSQTTADESDPAAPYNTHLSSDDAPQFVSARPVKRRRGNSPRVTKLSTQIKKEHASISQPYEINSENFSSPTMRRSRVLRRETSNLDSVSEGVDSPVHRRERRASSAGALRPPRMPTTASSLSEGGMASTILHEQAKEEPESFGETPDETVTTRHSALQPERSDLSDRALQPLDANIARSTRPAGTSNMKRKRRDEDPRAKAAMVSEDGDMDSSQVNPQQTSNNRNPGVSRRLDNLLDEPTPGRNQVLHRSIVKKRPQMQPDLPSAPANTGDQKRSPAKKQYDVSRPTFEVPNVPTTTALPTPTSANGRSPRLLHARVPPQPRPEDESLRARPIIRLEIEDFKVNPKYKGTDFAFADTLRGRDERRCLPGCTKPECCGDAFRKAVEMGIKGKKSDDEVLGAYLGPNFKNHMASRPHDERNEILIKARTYAFASEYGKHRQAFKRRASPPGFWRIDMPSTQEEEQDRLKALELTRQEVYDRWREAMKPDGRWKFRDE